MIHTASTHDLLKCMPLAFATGHLVDWMSPATEANAYVAYARLETGVEELTKTVVTCAICCMQ